jgi:CRISPR type IV-associated protein Csf3
VPVHPLHLDGLLAYAVALRDELPPALTAEECAPIAIPVQREPSGRFHLCSAGIFVQERAELRYTNRRAPIEQYQTIGDAKIRRCQITAGANKSYRIPRELAHLESDLVTWYCLGDREQIEVLLQHITHLGKKRSVGWGKILRWTVEECATWEGFPVTRDGAALRTLPLDWPGLRDPSQSFETLTYPYWDRSKEEPCAIPRHH